MVKDYGEDNLIAVKFIFFILCQLANSSITETRISFKLFTDLHDNVTEMVYINTYSQSRITINLSSNAL